MAELWLEEVWVLSDPHLGVPLGPNAVAVVLR
jgi:hypothetical protein